MPFLPVFRSGGPGLAFETWVSLPLAFHHHARHCHTPRVGKRKRDRLHPEFRRKNGSSSAKFERGSPTRLTPYLEFVPRNPSTDSGSQRLRPRLFGCKSRRKAFRAHPLASAIGNLMI